jgi:hypothetical protein
LHYTSEIVYQKKERCNDFGDKKSKENRENIYPNKLGNRFKIYIRNYQEQDNGGNSETPIGNMDTQPKLGRKRGSDQFQRLKDVEINQNHDDDKYPGTQEPFHVDNYC